MRHKTRSPSVSVPKAGQGMSLRSVGLVGLTLLSLALGGSTQLWAQSIIILLAAALILLLPARAYLGVLPLALSLLFLGLASSAFLPAAWDWMPSWRRHLTVDLDIPLGPFRTPQPWLTLQSCGLVLFGVVWIYYLLAQDWTPAEKSRALRLLLVGVMILAGVSIWSYATGTRVPGWNQEQNRGWFPNRNQTSDVLALTGIVSYAIGFRAFRTAPWQGVFWMAGLAILFSALIVSYSRAGIVMFFVGIALWHLGSAFRPGQGKSLALGLALMLLLLTLFLIFGGDTLERFLHVPGSDDPYEVDYRVLIQEDALRFSLSSPFLGVGLGNFQPLFTATRALSAGQNKTLHPESDWLWMASEMGWIAPIVILVAIKWWVDQCRPFEDRAGESVRRAVVIAVVLFILHGFVDVSGHRLGSWAVAMLLASIALSTSRPLLLKSWVSPTFRCLGLVLVGFGGWWLASLYSDKVPPTTAQLERIQSRVDRAATDGQFDVLAREANAALALAPLDWTYYFRRASASAFLDPEDTQAAHDFAVARFLEPNWIDLCFNEGEVWLAAGKPDQCVEAWKEAIRRSSPKALTMYAHVLELSENEPLVHRGLKKLASTDADYLVTFLAYATPDEAKAALDALLARDPGLQTLNFGQQQKLFAAWYDRGDRAEMANLLLLHEDWKLAGWPSLVQYLASQQEYELAVLTAMRYLQAPVVRQIDPDAPLETMQSRYDLHPTDVVEGVMLCQAEMKAGRPDEALVTIGRLEKCKDCPRYVHYLKAQVCILKQDWPTAWDALQSFGLS